MEGADGLVVHGEGAPDERARDDDTDDRDTDQPGDTGDRVVDRGRDPRVGLVGIGEHGGGERGDRHRETDGEDEHRGKEIGEVGGLDARPQQEQDAGGGDERAGAHEQARAVRGRRARRSGGRGRT